ncbi:MAG: L,D-transpeptidase family protein [Allosphingosinicella sp.]|uniref:L,D-transpeptidase family protein n=1 Tax=Allosphingosinicella sp. TaxID=2823234 RepID=UPI003954962A
MPNYLRLAILPLILASPTMPGSAQSGAAPRLDYQMPGAAQPAPQLGYQVPPPPVETAPRWSRAAAEDLLLYLDRVGEEGLDPAWYDGDRLRAALASGDETAWQGAASDIFLRLSADLSQGYVRGSDRVGWHMPGFELNGDQQRQLMARAIAEGRVAPALSSLLPTHAQYQFLKRALAATAPQDSARRELIRVNMERWRWMPRELGARHIIVNVPAFTAAIVDNGQVTARHRTIVGKTSTPTPQLRADAVAVTFNPWWNVPASIVREMNGRYGGYEVTRGADGIRLRQAPGPRNALGRMKVEMPNDYAIYLHDTPAKALFDRPVRAFSHGCIRTQDALGFAQQLLAPTDAWDRARIDKAAADGKTVRANLSAPVPVFIAYFTAAATEDGRIVTYSDLYGRDAPVRKALTAARS